MHDGEIVEFFDTARDAFVAGEALFNAASTLKKRF